MTGEDAEEYFPGYGYNTTTYPTSAFEVIHGNPSGLRSTAQYYSDTALVLETLATDVRAAANRSRTVWDGDTGPTARAAVRDTSARIQALVQPVRDVAVAHTALADTLEYLQGKVEDYWDSAARTHLPQYGRAQWMSGAIELEIKEKSSDGLFTSSSDQEKQDLADLVWLRSEIFRLKADAATARAAFYDVLVSAQPACDVIDPAWAMVDVPPGPTEPAAPEAPAVPSPPPAPDPGGDGGGGGGGGAAGGGGGGGGGRPALPSLPPVPPPSLDVPEFGELLEVAPVEVPILDEPLDVDAVPVAGPAAPLVAPDVASPVPDPVWAAEQVAVRESLDASPWTIQDDTGWTSLVRADAGLQTDLATRTSDLAAEAVRRFLETGATEGTFDVVSGQPHPVLGDPAATAEGASATPVAPSFADRLGVLPPGAAAPVDAADGTPGELHHHGSTTVVRMDDGTFSVTVDAAYEWSGRIAPDATFADGSWQHGAAGILTGGAAAYDLSIGWGGTTTVALDVQGAVLGTTTTDPR